MYHSVLDDETLIRDTGSGFTELLTSNFNLVLCVCVMNGLIALLPSAKHKRRAVEMIRRVRNSCIPTMAASYFSGRPAPVMHTTLRIPEAIRRAPMKTSVEPASE